MRTKALVLTAVLGAAASATTYAQVYSVNAVGYVNVTCNPGFTMIANPLDAGAGNNTLKKLITGGVPANTKVYRYNGTGYDIATFAFGNWSVDIAMEPGDGVFIQIPGTAAATLTFVGDVKQGTVTTAIPLGFSIKASPIPQEARLDGNGTGNLGFPAQANDVIYRYTGTGYNQSTYAFGNWQGPGGIPTPKVGEAFWVKTSAARPWTRTFSVNP